MLTKSSDMMQKLKWKVQPGMYVTMFNIRRKGDLFKTHIQTHQNEEEKNALVMQPNQGIL